MSRHPYLAMIGKYVRMERHATAEEQAAGYPPTIGMEGVVDRVDLGPDGSATIRSDYGYEYTVTPDTAPGWEFTVWPDEESAERSRAVPSAATTAEWVAKALADPDAPVGTITFRPARAVFDATGRSGWES